MITERGLIVVFICSLFLMSCSRLGSDIVDDYSKQYFLTEDNLKKWNAVTVDSFNCIKVRVWGGSSSSSMCYRDKLVVYSGVSVNECGRRKLFKALQSDTLFNKGNGKVNEIILLEFEERESGIIRYFLVVKEHESVMLYYYDLHAFFEPKRFGPVKISAKNYLHFLECLELPINEFEVKDSYYGDVYISKFNAKGIYLYNFVGYNFTPIHMRCFNDLNPFFVDLNIQY